MTGPVLAPFDPERFEALRAARGLRWGRPLVYGAETGSTNDDALAAGRAGAPGGSLFVADHQRAGRGRRGRSWSAPPRHHLLFSLLLRPGAAAAPAALTLAVGLGVRAALAARCREPLRVKWPNDVLAGARKIAGILCEAQLEAARLEALVIGVGINVRTSAPPAELEGQLICLEQLGEGGAPPERELLLVDVLTEVSARLERCLEAGFSGLAAEFAEHDALRGERVQVSGAAPLRGRARGVDELGRLLVESDGLLVPVVSGTVRAEPPP